MAIHSTSHFELLSGSLFISFKSVDLITLMLMYAQGKKPIVVRLDFSQFCEYVCTMYF